MYHHKFCKKYPYIFDSTFIGIKVYKSELCHIYISVTSLTRSQRQKNINNSNHFINIHDMSLVHHNNQNIVYIECIINSKIYVVT